MKKIVGFTLILVLMFSMLNNIVFAADNNFYTNPMIALKLVPSPLDIMTRINRHPINLFVYDNYGIISYGRPYGEFYVNSSGKMTDGVSKGEYKYLGYDVNDNPITNDYYHKPVEANNATFTTNYRYYYGNPPSGTTVTWLPVSGAASSWRYIDEDVLAYIKNTDFYDDDHPTKYNTTTGYSLSKLLGGNIENYAFVQSLPTESNDGSVRLSWSARKADGTIKYDYNTVFIPRLPAVVPPPPAAPAPAPLENPELSTTATGGDMNPNLSTRIQADNRGSEKFDVLKGIPTTEKLYAEANTKEYLSEYEFTEHSGQIDYVVKVRKTYNLSWYYDNGSWDTDYCGNGTSYHGPGHYCTDTNRDGKNDSCPGHSYYGCRDSNGDGRNDYCPGHSVWDSDWQSRSDTITVEVPYTISRPFSYYTIDRLELYKLDSAIFNNYALTGGSITVPLNTSMYTSPSLTYTHSNDVNDHLIRPTDLSMITITLPEENLSGGYSGKPLAPGGVNWSSYRPNWTSHAEGAVGAVKVRNDSLVFNYKGTHNIMNDNWVDADTPDPSSIPIASNNNNAIFKSGNVIDENKLNGVYHSNGSVRYVLADSLNPDATEKVFNFNSNDVIIHTPVVCYPSMTNDLTYNQVVDLDTSKPNIIIDRGFNVTYPNSGQHLNITGYGNRDYSAYIEDKQIQFNFDCYFGNDRTGTYIPQGSWYSIPENQSNYNFYIPHWVEEGDYSIKFRTIAVNAPAGASGQTNSNGNRNNYYAESQIDVAVVGQMYDFKILSTTDSMFETFFFNSGVLRNHLFAGNKNKYGNVDPSHMFTLPIMPGKNNQPGYQNKAIKLGHSVFFSVKTNGNMKDNNDFIMVKPKFYYVNASGGARQEVDIWYEKDNKVLKLSNEPVDLQMALNNKYTGISQTVLSNTAKANYVPSGGYTLNDFVDNFIWSESKKAKKIGATNFLALDFEQKVYVGDITNLPAGVSQINAITGVQEFYGMYCIPKSSIFVPIGTPRNDLFNRKLTKGYVIVSFDIASIDNYSGNANDIHLSYSGASCNMFDIENYSNTQNGFSLLDGDSIFYYTDQTADKDYSIIGTH